MIRTLEPELALPQDLSEQLRKRIVERRKSMDMTQKLLAERIGISNARYNHYERGFRKFPLSLLPDIASALDCTEADLIGNADSKPKKRGPASRFEQLGERFAKLPRNKQKIVIEMLESWLDKAS